VKVNWASGLDANGRPIQTPQPKGSPTWPGTQGGTNWYPPSFSPRTGLFYASVWDNYGAVFSPGGTGIRSWPQLRGGGFTVVSPTPGAPTIGVGRAGHQQLDERIGSGATVAIDPRTESACGRFANTT